MSSDPPSVYDVVHALAQRSAKRSGHQTIPHASASEIAEALGNLDVEAVRAPLEAAMDSGYIAEHPEYNGMYYVTDAGEGFMDAAAFAS